MAWWQKAAGDRTAVAILTNSRGIAMYNSVGQSVHIVVPLSVEVKSVILQVELRRGADLPFMGLEPVCG